MSQRKNWIGLITGVFLIAVVVACTTQPQQGQVSPTPPALPTENPFFEVPRVTLEEAKTAFDSGSAVFVDTRSATSFADVHIPGALSIPVAEIESRMDELDPNQWIITYCT